MRILVTGGAGFIGSHLCDRLLERGDRVWCLDNLRLGRRRNVAQREALPDFHFLDPDVLARAAPAVSLRFPNVVGERATHGVIYDFLRKLAADRGKLEVLGDGKQSKPYVYVGDLVDAIVTAWDKADAPFAVYHAAGIGSTSVHE